MDNESFNEPLDVVALLKDKVIECLTEDKIKKDKKLNEYFDIIGLQKSDDNIILIELYTEIFDQMLEK